MTDEERDRLNEAKTFAWAAPLVLPLIERRKRAAVEMLLREYREGKTDHTNRVAELNAFYTIEQELKQKAQEYATLEEQYAASRKPDSRK